MLTIGAENIPVKNTVIVLGSGRSGTSVVAGLLSLLGYGRLDAFHDTHLFPPGCGKVTVLTNLGW